LKGTLNRYDDSATLAGEKGASLARRLKRDGASLAVANDRLVDVLAQLLGVEKDHDKKAQPRDRVDAARRVYIAGGRTSGRTHGPQTRQGY
jgi:hypothetical protein